MTDPGLEPLPPWNAPGYGVPRNGVGLAALIVGILALMASITVVFGILLGIVALVLGLVGRSRAKQGVATNGGIAITGAVLGVVSMLIGLAFVVFVWRVSDTLEEQYRECRTRATSNEERAACDEEYNLGEPP